MLPKKVPKNKQFCFEIFLVDKSRKGSVDEPIRELVEQINSHDDLYTTSSCSGRVSLFGESTPATRSEGKKGGKWIYTSHYPPEHQTITNAVFEFLKNAENTERLDLRFEPFILACECRTLEISKQLTQAGLESGFRESGVILGNDRFTVTIRSSARMEVPLCQNGVLFVTTEYLEYLTNLICERFHKNTAKIAQFYKAMQKVLLKDARELSVTLEAQCNSSEMYLLSLNWEKVNLHNTEDERHLQRWGHSVCCIRNQFVVFGGYGGQSSHQRLNDIVCFNSVSKTIHFPVISGTIPAPRMHHTATTLGDSIYIIGGRSNPQTALEDVFKLDTTTWRFEKLQVSLPGRFRHSSCEFGGNQIIIFGGCGNSGVCNDLLMVNIDTMQVKELKPIGLGPCARISHAACVLGDSLFIHGGFSDYTSTFNDLFQLNLSTLVWTEIVIDGFQLPCCFSHCLISLEDDLLMIFGGCPKTQEDKVVLLSPYSRKAKALRTTIGDSTSWVSIRQKPVLSNDEIYVIGGGAFCFSFGSIFSSIHSMNVSKLKMVFDSLFARKQDLVNLENDVDCLQGILVHKKQAKLVKDLIKEQKWLDAKYKSTVVEFGQRVAFPLTNVGAEQLCKSPRFPLVDSNTLTMGNKSPEMKQKLHEFLNGVEVVLQKLDFSLAKNKASALSPGERLRSVLVKHLKKSGLENDKGLLHEIPVKWEKLGDLVLLPENCLKSPKWNEMFPNGLWREVAEALSCVRLARQARISNSVELRFARSELLLGTDGWVHHRENGILFALDITKCMFCSGNVSERIRMSQLSCNDEIIVDLYCGIGYYSIPILVFACEWNRHAVKALSINLKTNGVESSCVVLEGDCRKVAPKSVADRVLLGLLPTSQGGWKTAIEALKPSGGWLHLHENVKDIAEMDWTQNTIETLKNLAVDCGYKWEISVKHCEHVKWYAPHIRHIVLDIFCQPTQTPDPSPFTNNNIYVAGKNLTEDEFWNGVVVERQPKIIKNADLGDAVRLWTSEYLAAAEESQTTIVSSHVCTEKHRRLNFVNKNFSFQSMTFAELIERCSQLKLHTPFLSPDESYYLRSIGMNPRKERSWIHKSFPVLSQDLKLPSFLDEKKLFSTVLRVSSPGVQLWTHFDVMDNLLIQVTGTKRIKLWPPSAEPYLYIKGSSSEVVNIEDPDLVKYPEFSKATCMEWTLEPGDVLYIPALWFHNVKSMDFAVSVNAFFHHLPKELYENKDLYGNRDPIPVQQAQHHSKQIIELLQQLPDDYRKFYSFQILRNIESNGL
eukprot:g8607.t1